MEDRLARIALHQAIEAKRAANQLRREVSQMNQRLLDLEAALDALVSALLQ